MFFEIFDDVMANNWLNFGERIRMVGEGIITCIINKKEVGGANRINELGENI